MKITAFQKLLAKDGYGLRNHRNGSYSITNNGEAFKTLARETILGFNNENANAIIIEVMNIEIKYLNEKRKMSLSF